MESLPYHLEIYSRGLGLLLEEDWYPTRERAERTGMILFETWCLRGFPSVFTVTDETGWVADIQE